LHPRFSEEALVQALARLNRKALETGLLGDWSSDIEDGDVVGIIGAGMAQANGRCTRFSRESRVLVPNLDFFNEEGIP
jgi:hypothetical protein